MYHRILNNLRTKFSVSFGPFGVALRVRKFLDIYLDCDYAERPRHA